MPKCHLGDHFVSSSDLRLVGGALACSACRKLKGIEGEAEMSQVKKSVILLNISEVDKESGKDHLIEAQVGLGGLNLSWSATFDQVRDFFTKRREKAAKASPLKAL